MTAPDVIDELEIIDFSGFTPEMKTRYEEYKKIAGENKWAITWVNYQMFKEFGSKFDDLRTCVATGYTGESILPPTPKHFLSASDDDEENLELGSEWEEKQYKYNPHKKAQFTSRYNDDEDDGLTPEYKAALIKFFQDYVNGTLPPYQPSSTPVPPVKPVKKAVPPPKQTNLFG